MTSIPFSIPTEVGTELTLVRAAMDNRRLSGDGAFTVRAAERLGEITGVPRVLLTGSCTHALEMTALLLNVAPGDEIIMPSYTFVSTANAFVQFGGVPVFVDVDPTTMNVSADAIEAAITPRTRAIVVVHYAGVACDMERILGTAEEHGLPVIEDAAQAIDAWHDDRHLGTLGAFGTLSFHDTKNVTSGGEGGALLVNDPAYWSRANILREKGTNRTAFLEGLVDKYSWVDSGSSYLMAEINAAFLSAQLEVLPSITRSRLDAWKIYRQEFEPLVSAGVLQVASVPAYARHNGHLFFAKVESAARRQQLTRFLRDRGITAPFHYVPLHSSKGGVRFSRFSGVDAATTDGAERLIRFPLFHGITERQVLEVCAAVRSFFGVDAT
jgi:dTDP-4-amino-4,6-dideoxygalactose transaminase